MRFTRPPSTECSSAKGFPSLSFIDKNGTGFGNFLLRLGFQHFAQTVTAAVQNLGLTGVNAKPCPFGRNIDFTLGIVINLQT
jgi:hypothetical protein